MSKTKSIDMDEFVAELNHAASGKYTDMDRYREFRKVFLETDEGKRVMRQIMAWGHIWHSSFDANPAVMSFAEGERGLALKIIAAVNVEPVEKPTRQNLKKET